MPTDALLPRAARLGAASQAARPNPGWMAGGAAPRRQPRRPSKTARARDEHAVHLRARRLRRSQGLASTGVCRLFSASRFYIRAVDVSAQTNRESRALESVRPATADRPRLWRPPPSARGARRGLELNRLSSVSSPRPHTMLESLPLWRVSRALMRKRSARFCTTSTVSAARMWLEVVSWRSRVLGRRPNPRCGRPSARSRQPSAWREMQKVAVSGV